MALRTIVTLPDETLRKKCKPVERFDPKLAELIDDMAQTMYKAEGVGIAANQVGILRRVIYIDVGEGGIELVNPVIISEKGSQRAIEGCLSCPNLWGYVTRPLNVVVKAYNRFGNEVKYKCSEYFARCLVHEIEHLDGKLFTDSADEMVDSRNIKDKN